MNEWAMGATSWGDGRGGCLNHSAFLISSSMFMNECVWMYRFGSLKNVRFAVVPSTF